MEWPPDYTKILLNRTARMDRLRDPAVALGAKEYYRDRPIEWIEHWAITYDPRNGANGLPKMMPFVLFPRQREYVDFICALINSQTDGLVEKSRDMGATWISCALSVHQWIYNDGISIGWGSRKEQLVDRLGDPDSIFEKMRLILDYLPQQLRPKGYDRATHATYMKLINPETGATITGEAGDNIGRGGRKAIYFKDEAAYYERPELIEAALADNTNVQVDISSVNGTNNVFYRRRTAGEIWTPDSQISRGAVQVLIMDWRDHPAKDQEWYDRRRAKAEADGLLHVFAQEVDRDYAAAIEGVIIPPAWVKSAIDAHEKLGIKPSGQAIAGLDVADEGGDKNALVIRKGIVVQYADHWGEGDTGTTARKAVMQCRARGVTSLQYDCIGVGAGVKSECNNLRTAGKIPDGFDIVPWNAAKGPLWPERRVNGGDRDSPKNKDFYSNLKAQAWWELRGRFERTHRAVTQGAEYDAAELISIPSTLPNLHALVNELSQPTYKHNGAGKLVIDKKPNSAQSPNLADAFVMAFWPAKQSARFFA